MRADMLREGTILALDQLRVNKTRSALTIFGIVVGVATVMAMSAMVAGVRSSILDGIAAAGPKNFIVGRFNWNEVRFAHKGPPWGTNPRIQPEEARRIGTLPAIKEAIPG